jgi:hypothetical protein
MGISSATSRSLEIFQGSIELDWSSVHFYSMKEVVFSEESGGGQGDVIVPRDYAVVCDTPRCDVLIEATLAASRPFARESSRLG